MAFRRSTVRSRSAPPLKINDASPSRGEPLSSDVADHLSRVIGEMIRAEAASGWALCRRVPSTFTWRSIDYLNGLSAADRNEYFDAVRRIALSFFNTPAPSAENASGSPALQRYREAMTAMGGDSKYLDARLLRMILGDVTGKRPTPALANTPLELLERAAAIEPTSSSEIRKKLKARLADSFGARGESLGAGNWKYAAAANGVKFEIGIDYGGRSDQLRYGVSFTALDGAMKAHDLVYERLVGVGLGKWDFVTATNLDASLDLLCELIRRLLEIPVRLKK